MNTLVFFLTELVLGLAMMHLSRRGPMRPFPDIAVLYLMHLEMVLYLQTDGYIDYDFLKTFSSYSFINNFVYISIIMGVYGYILPFFKYKSNNNIDFKDIFSGIIVPSQVIMVISLIMYTITLLLAIHLKWNEVWFNTSYLLMTSPDILDTETKFGIFLIQSQMLISVISTAILFLLYFQGNRLWVLFAPLFAWRYLYFIAAHSRSAVLLMGIAALFAILFKRKAAAGLFIALAIMSLLQALEGRNSGFHGFSQLGRVFEYSYIALTEDFGQVIANTGEGMFSATEAFVFRPHFETAYIIGSFSPLLSVIDGFDKVQKIDEIRLGLYAPMSAIEETISFGPLFFILFIGTQFLACYATTKAISKKPGILSLLCNSMVLFGYFFQWAYTTRWAYRYFLYAILGSLIV